VSHDRYFLDKIVGRLLIIDPPNLTDFEGGYRKWVEKTSNTRAAVQSETQSKKPPRAKPPFGSEPQGRSQAAREARDNPYKRQFGRLTVEELEKQIHETEQAVKECQVQFGDPETFRDPARARQLQAEYESLQEKLRNSRRSIS
jgi:ATP-binding cassette subfamily F protein 3